MSISLISYSQINFENSYLKDFLLTKNSDLITGYHIPEVIDTNNDNEIDSSEAKNIILISIEATESNHNTQNFRDIVNFPNLQQFLITRKSNAPNTPLLTIDFTKNLLLERITLNNLGINSIDLSKNKELKSLSLLASNLSNLNITENTELKSLNIVNNSSNLDNIDTSNNKKLISLTLRNCGLNSIDVSQNNLLNRLYLLNSFVTEINLDNNCNLQYLSLLNNRIQTVDARNCKLQSFKARGGMLKRIYLAEQPFDESLVEQYNFEFQECSSLEFICIDDKHNNLAKQQMTNSNQIPYPRIKGNNPNCVINSNCGIPSNPKVCDVITPCPIINFPDPNFKQALLNHTPIIDIDGDGDGEICIEEAEATNLIRVPFKNINSAIGIEYFINLKALNLIRNNLTSIDLSKNTKLIGLELDSNNLTSIDLSNNNGLKFLYFSYNKIKQIDLSNNPDLIQIYAQGNLLENIDIGNSPFISLIHIDDNNLDQIDISNNVNLYLFTATNNKLNQLDVRNNINLTGLNLKNNKISSLELSNNRKLESIDIENNLIESIDITKCNRIKRLNIENNPKLKKAFLKGNHIFYDDFATFINNDVNEWSLKISNIPNLEFVCVKDVPFFNDIKNHINNTLGYTNCTVSTNCDAAPTFTDYFTLSPNPASSFIKLTKQQTITATSAQILNYSGQVIQTVNLNFNTLAFKPFANININALAVGNYIIRIPTNKGTLTSTFIKISNFPFR